MIKTQNLEYSYPKSETKAVKDMNFEMNAGEIFGILGPDGSGKSTTQKILTGLLRNYWGKVLIFKRELREWDMSLYNRIGVSFELPNHYSKLTGIENMNFFRSLYSSEKEDAYELLEMVGLEKDADTKVFHYSTGMKMRLNFARALINKPQVLLLDEPTIGMDPLDARTIKKIINNKKKEGKTIFLTTNDTDIIDELCDRAALLVDGHIKIIDSPRNLKTKYGKRIVKVEYINGQSITEEFQMEDIGKNEQFLRTIKNKEICKIHTQETSLQDIFTKITGRKIN